MSFEYCYGRRSTLLLVTVAALFSVESSANYSCHGAVSYLGIEANGDMAIQLADSTPIHKICNVIAQGVYQMALASCKVVYTSFLTAKIANLKMTTFYTENGMNCSTLPSWGVVPQVYFVQGPD